MSGQGRPAVLPPDSPCCDNSPVRSLGLLAATLVLGAAACGGGTSATPTPDFAKVASATAKAALLTVDDLPGGWTEDAGGPPIGGLDTTLSQQCHVVKSDRAFPDAPATDESPGFSGPGDKLANSLSAVYQSAADADSGLRKLRETVFICHDELVQAVKKAAEDELDKRGINLGIFGRLDVSLEEASPPALGDGALAYHVNVDAGVPVVGGQFNLDIFVVRKGRVIGAIAYGGFGTIDETEERAIQAALSSRLSKAEAMLPPVPSSSG